MNFTERYRTKTELVSLAVADGSPVEFPMVAKPVTPDLIRLNYTFSGQGWMATAFVGGHTTYASGKTHETGHTAIFGVDEPFPEWLAHVVYENMPALP